MKIHLKDGKIITVPEYTKIVGVRAIKIEVSKNVSHKYLDSLKPQLLPGGVLYLT